MPTYRLDIEYDGTDWHGWQIQPDRPTIQDAIQHALRTAIRRDEVLVTGSGRTDAGVHATGQVAHFSIPDPVQPTRLKASLNGLLPASIAIRDVRAVPDGFHARFDACSRQYRYRISSEPVALERAFIWHIRPEPNVELMNKAAALLVGRFDFSSFCRTKSETTNRVCHVQHAAWVEGPRSGAWDFVIRADRFLHGMVRSIVGTLMEVGSPSDMYDILMASERTVAGPSAPAKGLVLEKVSYEHTTT